MTKKILLAALSVALLCSQQDACADAKANPAVLTFKDKKGKSTTYYRSDVLKYKQALPEEIRFAPDEAVFSDVRDQLLLDLLFADAIETDSLESDPEVTSELKSAKVEIMKRIWMKRQLNKMVKDEDLVKSYGKIKDSIKGKKVYNTAIIVLNDESTAQSVLKEAQSGKNFADLAKKHSIENATKERGGEIGFLPEEHIARLIDPDASKKIKVLKDGVCSNRIFKKDGKSIIIKRVGMKDAEVPEYKKIESQLKAIEMQKAVGTLAKDLLKKKGSNVQVKDYQGNPDKPLKKALEATK